MGVSMVIGARGGVTYTCMSVCMHVYVRTYVRTLRDSTDNVLSCSHLCCYFHSTSQYSWDTAQPTYSTYVCTYIMKHAVVGDGSMVNWYPDVYVHTTDVHTYIILPAVFTHACMHTQTLISSPNCSQPLPQVDWYSLQGHTMSRVTESTH